MAKLNGGVESGGTAATASHPAVRAVVLHAAPTNSGRDETLGGGRDQDQDSRSPLASVGGPLTRKGGPGDLSQASNTNPTAECSVPLVLIPCQFL